LVVSIVASSLFSRAPVLLYGNRSQMRSQPAQFFQLPVAGDMGTIARSRTPELPSDDEIAVQRALALWTKGQAHDCCEKPGKPDRDGDHRYQPWHQCRDQQRQPVGKNSLACARRQEAHLDRKSTRLNSSHT